MTARSPIVSMTTVPSRIDQIKPTLVSLLRQSLPPKEIHINIGQDYFERKGKSVPDFLKSLSIVKVCYTPIDRGPCTKFIPTLERLQGKDELIVVVDDDMYYAPDLLEVLVSADQDPQMNPNRLAVFCINGLLLPKDLRGENRPSDKAIKSGTKRVAIVEGCGGYTLRPEHVSLKDLLNTEGAPERCFFNDDFWLSGFLSRNGIAKIQIPAGRRKSLVNTITPAISGDRIGIMTDLMHHFKNDWKPEEYDV